MQQISLSPFALALWLLLAPGPVSGQQRSSTPDDPAHSKQNTNLLPCWEQRLLKQFEAKLYTLLTDAETGCVDCHSSEGNSALVLSGQPLEDLRLLLDNHYLQATGPDSLLGRVSSEHAQRRMPKNAEPWSRKQINELASFVNAVEQVEDELGVQPDEQFPRSLLADYHADAAAVQAAVQFISYRQLVAKIQLLFDDDGIRGDRDLFAENLAMLGGADFKTRFNESTDPTASFLTSLELLASDVATRAYQRRRGPFANWQLPTSDPRELQLLDASHRQAIEQLYRKILYRAPNNLELSQAFKLVREIAELGEEISHRDSQVAFELTVTDPETGLSAKRTVDIPVSGERLPLRQIVVDQRGAAQQLARSLLGECVYLGTGQSTAQRLVLTNHATQRNVSFAGIQILLPSGELVSEIKVNAPSVLVDGAWELNEQAGFLSYEDANRHKGLSSISVPLHVQFEGYYQIALLWRADPANAPRVLVQLFAAGQEDELKAVTTVHRPEPNVARFYYDCSNDAEPFRELDGQFQFDESGYVAISNDETLQLVTAGAVEFLPVDESSAAIVIDSRQAEGNEAWSEFDEGRFKAYNVKGKKLHDDNQHKGELSLSYRPAAADPQQPNGWSPDVYYRVRVYYPGKRDQETQVPVQVAARRSSPIIQIAHPVIAKAGAWLTLDASASYTLQESRLKYDWKQVSGPTVDLPDAQSARIEFEVPRLSARQFAWSALCSSLLRHPDFLFTRPPSLDTAGAEDQQVLQLVRVAQDLIGRPPSQSEIDQLKSGAGYAELVDTYLDSQEFRDFYFHHVRLYLESQGTSLQDEPVRLWCHVAFADRPFQELLTADYTVDENFKVIQRPVHHGRTGLLTTAGFIQGKPGLPHYNYAAQVSMLFLGYVYEVPPEIVEQREGVTALGTTDPNSSCYSCHKILTPLALQRAHWTDEGVFQTHTAEGLEIDASDGGCVPEYPFPGQGLEAFATAAVKKERFVRTIINTHANFYLGRPLRYREDERLLYRQLWDNVHKNNFKIRQLIRCLVTSDAYLR